MCPDGLLHFGDTVIIHAPVVQPRKGQSRSRGSAFKSSRGRVYVRDWISELIVSVLMGVGLFSY